MKTDKYARRLANKTKDSKVTIYPFLGDTGKDCCASTLVRTNVFLMVVECVKKPWKFKASHHKALFHPSQCFGFKIFKALDANNSNSQLQEECCYSIP